MSFMLFSRIRKRSKKATYSILKGSGPAKDIVLNGLEEGGSILSLSLEVT
jgi:hypothetical protein